MFALTVNMIGSIVQHVDLERKNRSHGKYMFYEYCTRTRNINNKNNISKVWGSWSLKTL